MEGKNSAKTCLLIAPTSFYSYCEYIRKTLSTYGYNVSVSNDEYPANLLGKIMGKLRSPVLLYLTAKKIRARFIKDKSYDLVLIVKGRGISKSLIDELKHVSPRVIGYSFDSFKYHPAPLRWYKSVHEFYTFDYRDSERHALPVIELFSSLPENEKPKKISYEVSAIVRNHSGRLMYIDKVLASVTAASTFVYIFEHNVFSLVWNFMKSPLLYLKFRKYIFFKPLPYQEYTRVLHESNFTIDFAHPSQTGITIRSFEALCANTKIITNNPNFSRYKFFNETNTILFDNMKETDRLRMQFEKIKSCTPQNHCRTVNHFVEEIIS